MKIDDPDFLAIVQAIQEEEKKLHAHPLFKVLFAFTITWRFARHSTEK
jgi:hypothetical protein